VDYQICLASYRGAASQRNSNRWKADASGQGFFDRLRQPDHLSQPKRFESFVERLLALRPYLTAGLPLSCAIVN